MDSLFQFGQQLLREAGLRDDMNSLFRTSQQFLNKTFEKSILEVIPSKPEKATQGELNSNEDAEHSYASDEERCNCYSLDEKRYDRRKKGK